MVNPRYVSAVLDKPEPCLLIVNMEVTPPAAALHDFERQKAVAIDAMRRGELTPAQVAELMGLSRQAVYRWCRLHHINPDQAAQRHAAAVWHRLTSGQFESKAQKSAKARKLVDEYYKAHPYKRK